MSIRRRGETITVTTYTASSTDEYGDPTFTSADKTVLAWVTPTSSLEANVDRETRSRTYACSIDYAHAVAQALTPTGTNTVTLADGTVTRVLGEPILRRGLRGPHHYELTLEEVLG